MQLPLPEISGQIGRNFFWPSTQPQAPRFFIIFPACGQIGGQDILYSLSFEFNRNPSLGSSYISSKESLSKEG
jgi:hypothetical protein